MTEHTYKESEVLEALAKVYTKVIEDSVEKLRMRRIIVEQQLELTRLKEQDTIIEWNFSCQGCGSSVKTKDPNYPVPLCQDCHNARKTTEN